MPTVVYPFHLPSSGPPDLGLPPEAPPEPIAEGGAAGPYVWVGGVWGYWDQNHRFHRAAAVAGRPPARPRLATGAAARRSVVHLPSATPGRILVQRAAPPVSGRTP